MTLPFLTTRAIQYDYDLQGRLTQIHNYKKLSGAGTALSTYSYTYDFDHPEYPEDPEAIWKGYRTGMDETVSTSPPANRTEKYDYDSLYQLIKSNYSGDLTDIFQWSYDSIGNRIQQTTSNPSSTTNYVYYQLEPGYNSQLLRHDGSKCYIWDLNGNLSCTYPKATVEECPAVDEPHEESSCPSSPLDAAGKALYSWDKDDRLTDLLWFDTSERHAQYFYDFNGNRYKKTVGSTTTTYLYHNEDIVKSGSKYYIHGPGIDEPAFICPNDSCANPYYYFADGLGSIRQIIDDANNSNIENLYRYGSWGELSFPFSKSENITNFYTYTSREISENDLYYYRARYYHCLIGKFISLDPIKNAHNFFIYVENLPILNTDPSGLFKIHNNCKKCERKISPSDPNEDFSSTIERETNDWCNKKMHQIIDSKLRTCIILSCAVGTIKCINDCDPDEGGHSPGKIGPFITRTAYICTNTLPPDPYKVASGAMGDISIHEWAHGCGWDHCENKGIPDESKCQKSSSGK